MTMKALNSSSIVTAINEITCAVLLKLLKACHRHLLQPSGENFESRRCIVADAEHKGHQGREARVRGTRVRFSPLEILCQIAISTTMPSCSAKLFPTLSTAPSTGRIGERGCRGEAGIVGSDEFLSRIVAVYRADAQEETQKRSATTTINLTLALLTPVPTTTVPTRAAAVLTYRGSVCCLLHRQLRLFRWSFDRMDASWPYEPSRLQDRQTHGSLTRDLGSFSDPSLLFQSKVLVSRNLKV